jgi:hypothetical protein
MRVGRGGRRPHIRRTVALLAAAALSSGATLWGGAAQANWFAATGAGGGGNTQCAGGTITDDKNVDFFYIEPSADMTLAGAYVRNTLLDPTAINTSYTSPENNHIDVLTRDRYYTDFCEAYYGAQWTTDGVYGVRGATSCDYLSGNRCDQADVRISTYYFDVHGQQGDRWILCHEVGHAIGLRHRNNEPPSGTG